MEAYAEVLSYAIPFFLILILIESIAGKRMGIQVNRAMDTISSLSSGMTNTIKSILGLTVVILSYGIMVDHLAIFEIKSTVLVYILAFIGLDFAGYWSHRFNHMVNVFWNRHIVHHSSEEYNLSCALRQSISAFIGIYFFLYIPLAIIGIPANVIAVVAPLHLFAQFWYHTRLINKMGWLEQIIVTPSHHRVHHAINPEYIDKNFSEIFIVWDKWFGTFQPELEDVPPVYGTKKPVRTWNPIIINFVHLWGLIKDAWRAQHWWDKIRIWFMPTGWRPADVAEKYPVTYTEDVYNRPKYDTPASPAFTTWSWFQLAIHNLLLIHMLLTIGDLGFINIVWYSIFIMLSIFSYTTLMDGQPLAFGVEILKAFSAGFILFNTGGWFGIDTIVPAGSFIMAGYVLTSIVVTFYFTKNQEEKEIRAAA